MGTVTALGSRNYPCEDGFSSQTREASTEIVSKHTLLGTTSPTEVVQALASQADARPKGSGQLADTSEPQRTSPITEQHLEKQSFAQQPGESDDAYYWRLRDALSHWRPSPPTNEAIQAKLGELQQMKQAIRDNPNFNAWRQGLKPEVYNNPTAYGGREPRDPFKGYTGLPLGAKTAQDAWIEGGYPGSPFERIAADGRVYFFSPSSEAYAPHKGPVGLEAQINENIGKLNDVLRMRSGQAPKGPPPTEWQSTSPSAPLYDQRQLQPLHQPILQGMKPVGQGTNPQVEQQVRKYIPLEHHELWVSPSGSLHESSSIQIPAGIKIVNSRKTPDGTRMDASSRKSVSSQQTGMQAGHDHPTQLGVDPSDTRNIRPQNGVQNGSGGTWFKNDKNNKARINANPNLDYEQTVTRVTRPGENVPLYRKNVSTLSDPATGDRMTFGEDVLYGNFPSPASREAAATGGLKPRQAGALDKAFRSRLKEQENQPVKPPDDPGGTVTRGPSSWWNKALDKRT